MSPMLSEGGGTTPAINCSGIFWDAWETRGGAGAYESFLASLLLPLDPCTFCVLPGATARAAHLLPPTGPFTVARFAQPSELQHPR
jgi:hypothetical protein